jgi:hypothetical protein
LPSCWCGTHLVLQFLTATLYAAPLLAVACVFRNRFDVFILVPCYKESWATIKRTLMCAMFARVPPGCRKHIILGNDGHDVVSRVCTVW